MAVGATEEDMGAADVDATACKSVGCMAAVVLGPRTLRDASSLELLDGVAPGVGYGEGRCCCEDRWGVAVELISQ